MIDRKSILLVLAFPPIACLLLGSAIMLAQSVQADKPEPKIYRLSPEKSLEYAKLEAKKREIERQWRELDTQENVIEALQGIPESELDRQPVVEGNHYTFYPKLIPETKKP